MKPYYEKDGIEIYHGDCRDVLPSIGRRFETCLTDPSYGIEFMGKDWDHSVPGVGFWRIIRASLLPGAMCLAFGGTRTYHRLTCAVEDAGFEIRDCLMWLYGSGYPKSLDISKAIDKAAGAKREVGAPKIYPDGTRAHAERPGGNEGWRRPWMDDEKARARVTGTSIPVTDAAKLWHGWGTALKPAWEPIVVAMNPTEGTFVENALAHGVAGLNIADCRTTPGEGKSRDHEPSADKPGDGSTSFRMRGGVRGGSADGRWPANLVLDDEAARQLDEQSGVRVSGANPSRRGSAKHKNCYGEFAGQESCVPLRGANAGGASRFFYTAKASQAERNEGFEVDNDHPTVKPIALMAYLVNLTATPTGGTFVDPFMGSGTTLVAARAAGRRAVGVELEEKYCEIAASRLAQSLLPI